MNSLRPAFPTPPVTELGHGITCIDTLQERPGLACCYLVERRGEYAFIETGTAPGVPRLLSVLESRGIDRARVRYVIPTHVHLDHAGGAGRLMRALPNATLIAHTRAVRHLVDPTKLIAGATAVYGAEGMARMYGQIVPVPETRTRALDEGEIPFGGGELDFIDTPGHARHHFCIWDEASRGFFTGDSFGLSYREFDGPGGPFLLPTTTPVQFEPESWLVTLDRLLAFKPERMYLTHFGMVGTVDKLAKDLREALKRYVSIARSVAKFENRHAHLRDALAEDAITTLRRLHAPIAEDQARQLLAIDMELNAQGLEVWLDRPAA